MALLVFMTFDEVIGGELVKFEEGMIDIVLNLESNNVVVGGHLMLTWHINFKGI